MNCSRIVGIAALGIAALMAHATVVSAQPVLVGPGGTGSYAAPEGGPAVLYDQNNNCGTNSITSQEFEAGNAAFSNRAADDFVVPAIDGFWLVEQVFVPGVYFNGPGPTPLVDVQFLTNSGSLPGAAVAGCTYNDLASFADAAGSLTISLPTACTLPTVGAADTTYWVTVRADMDFAPGGQWGWTERTVQSGSGSAWENPGNGFGSGCTTWSNRVTCGVGTQPDLCFVVSGTIGGFPAPLIQEIPTLSRIGLGAVGVALALGAFLVLRRRRQTA